MGYNRRRSGLGSCRAFLNPFADNVDAPKIPDGGCAMSCGIRNQQVFGVTNATAVSYIYFRPGISNPIMVWENGTTQGAITSAGSTAEFNWATPVTKLDCVKWRCVSAGMKLQLINNDDTNQGYFEAVRLPGDIDHDPSRMIDNPSYVSGRLKDLHQYIFQLKPSDGDQDFVNNANDSGPVYDPSFDTILVKIVGSAGVTATLAHIAGCFEYQYDDTSALQRFQTLSRSDLPAYAQARRILAGSLKAGRKIGY